MVRFILALVVLAPGALTIVAPAIARPPFSLKWESRPAAPVARQEVAYVQAGGKLYLAGGLESLGLSFFSNRHERFDPVTGRWERLAAMPLPAHHLSGVALRDRIYYIGGLLGYPFVATGAVWIYDPATNRFSSGASMPPGRGRGAAGVVAYGDRIYVAGGQPGLNFATPLFDAYDPIADKWIPLPDMPRAREHNAAAVVGDRLYVIGGRDGGRRVAETDAFDFATGRWITGLAPIPTPRGGLATAVVGDEIVAIGGETPGGGPAHAEVESYNPATNTWRSLAPLPRGRHGIQAAVLDGAVWIAGGDLALGSPVADNTVAIPTFAPPTVSALRIAPVRFRPALRGPMIATRGGGARVTFVVDGDTRVAITVTGPRGARGTVQRDVPAGTTTLRLTGRLRGRPLPAGRYRLDVRPRGGAATGASFRILRGNRGCSGARSPGVRAIASLALVGCHWVAASVDPLESRRDRNGRGPCVPRDAAPSAPFRRLRHSLPALRTRVRWPDERGGGARRCLIPTTGRRGADQSGSPVGRRARCRIGTMAEAFAATLGAPVHRRPSASARPYVKGSDAQAFRRRRRPPPSSRTDRSQWTALAILRPVVV
jgi:N-acetylneuraminic acid mutarotase